MGGHGVERNNVPAGKGVSEVYSKQLLIKSIASGIGGEVRRCPRWRQGRSEEDFDKTREGRVMVTCRLCLVSYSISELQVFGLKLTSDNNLERCTRSPQWDCSSASC